MSILIWETPDGENRLKLDFPDNENHLLWEFISQCNLLCRYCYPSRTSGNLSTRVDLVEIASRIAEEKSITHIHITGGEPTLSSEIVEVLSILKGKRVYLTTNLVCFNKTLEKILTQDSLESIAISLDSIDPSCNDWLRGHTDDVKKNIDRLLSIRKNAGRHFKVRLHCVITQKNLNKIPALLLWAKERGICEVSCQPVFIEESHPFFNELSLSADNLPQLDEIFSLEREIFDTKYSRTHSILLRLLLTYKNVYFVHNNSSCLKFIDARGVVWQCPIKKETLNGESRDVETKCKICIQCLTCLKHAIIEREIDIC